MKNGEDFLIEFRMMLVLNLKMIQQIKPSVKSIIVVKLITLVKLLQFYNLELKQ